MKFKIIVAYILYIVGIAKIIDWFIFWYNNESLALSNRPLFLENYVSRFPSFLKLLFSSKYELDALISIIIFIIAGLIFINEPNKILKTLAVTAFLFAFWNLFSLM